MDEREEAFPENFFAHFGAVARHLNAIAMNARYRFAHRIDRNFRKEPVPRVRRVRHQKVGVLVRGDVGMLAQHLERNRRSRARKPANVHGAIDLDLAHAASEYLRLEIAESDEERGAGVNPAYGPVEAGRHAEALVGRRLLGSHRR